MPGEYAFPLERFMTKERFERIRSFSDPLPTPCLVLDLGVVRENYRKMASLLPQSSIYYAVKANPHPEVISLLASLGACFDVASVHELDLLLSLGVSPERMSYGNTIKKERDIAYFFQKGVRLFASDSIPDVERIARAAPGSRVFFRILTEGLGADWPLSKKFGSHPDLTRHHIMRARDSGLEPWGISFHVGSQQRDIGQWSTAITTAAGLFSWAEEKGVKLRMLNMGGGFPSNYVEPTSPIEDYAGDIKRFLHSNFGEELPQIVMEPGRSMVGDCGVIVSEIVNIARKSQHDLQWVFLDVGKFSGLIETLDEAIKFPIFFQGSGEAERVIIAGPTCDSMDILYEKARYYMPASAKPGDRVYVLTTGAYTQSYSSVCFNGFPPLEAYVLPEE